MLKIITKNHPYNLNFISLTATLDFSTLCVQQDYLCIIGSPSIRLFY